MKPTSVPVVDPTDEPDEPDEPIIYYPTEEEDDSDEHNYYDPTENLVTPTDPANPTESVEPEEKVDAVYGFAERLYTTCLGRDADPDGAAYWANELKMGKSGAAVAEGFFFSEEFVNQGLSNKEFINRLYRTFMGREADQNGLDYWNAQLNNGWLRYEVFEGFINSTEWADICLDYGIRSGGTATPSYEKEASEEVLAFSARMYTTCLKRDEDEAGLVYWAQEMANLRMTGTEVAYGFFFSPEFLDQKVKDKEFIRRLYLTFMDREPDQDGMDYWLSNITVGWTRADIFYGFANAPEFAELCANAGILSN